MIDRAVFEVFGELLDTAPAPAARLKVRSVPGGLRLGGSLFFESLSTRSFYREAALFGLFLIANRSDNWLLLMLGLKLSSF